MSRPIPIDDVLEQNDRPIVDPDRTIGDTVELVPGNAPGEKGRLREIIRTRGGDEQAQLLTVTIAGSGIFESSVTSDSSAPRGPLVAVVEWGVRGARAKAELDIPQGGIVFSLVASYVQAAARYDGLLLVNGEQLDSAATGAPTPGPRQRVGAMVGYGSYGPSSHLTRTFRLDDLDPPDPGGDEGSFTNRIRVPSFAKRVQLMGLGLETVSYRVRLGAFDSLTIVDVLFKPGEPSRPLDLPGDAGFVEIQNLGPDVLANPTLVFELAL
jgi:hypothetical protein